MSTAERGVRFAPEGAVDPVGAPRVGFAGVASTAGGSSVRKEDGDHTGPRDHTEDTELEEEERDLVAEFIDDGSNARGGVRPDAPPPDSRKRARFAAGSGSPPSTLLPPEDTASCITVLESAHGQRCVRVKPSTLPH